MPRCEICGEKIAWTLRPWKHLHYITLHPDFAKWATEFLRKVWIVGVLVVALTALIEFGFSAVRGPVALMLALFLVVLYLAFAAVAIGYFILRVYRFRRDWRKSH